MAWRNCNASLALIAEVNARWPNRDKASDGTIGNASHAAGWTSSDHNPFVVIGGVGVVRARDIDKDGIDAAWLANYLFQLGQWGDPRLTGGGYIIFNRRITNPNFSGWHVYSGSNPHEHHIHVSFSRNRAGFDSTAGWGITGGGTYLVATAVPELEEDTVERYIKGDGPKPGSDPVYLVWATRDPARPLERRYVGPDEAPMFKPGEPLVRRQSWLNAIPKVEGSK